MATWRQALEAAMTDEEVARLMVLSRSRTEPASRVQRAQIHGIDRLVGLVRERFFTPRPRPGCSIKCIAYARCIGIQSSSA
jgi:hypothetical protein